jgi:hypothetical protein
MNIYSGFVQLVYFQDEYRLRDVVYYEGRRNDGATDYEIKNYMVFSDILSSLAYGTGNFKYIRQFEGKDRSGNNFKELTAHEMAEYDKKY